MVRPKDEDPDITRACLKDKRAYCIRRTNVLVVLASLRETLRSPVRHVLIVRYSLRSLFVLWIRGHDGP